MTRVTVAGFETADLLLELDSVSHSPSVQSLLEFVRLRIEVSELTAVGSRIAAVRLVLVSRYHTSFMHNKLVPPLALAHGV